MSPLTLPGLSGSLTVNLTIRPSAARPRSRQRPRTVVSILPPHNSTTTLQQHIIHCTANHYANHITSSCCNTYHAATLQQHPPCCNNTHHAATPTMLQHCNNTHHAATTPTMLQQHPPCCNTYHAATLQQHPPCCNTATTPTMLQHCNNIHHAATTCNTATTPTMLQHTAARIYNIQNTP